MSRSIGTVAFAFGLVSSVMADEFLGDAHQLTFPNQFAKAGEAYFSPHGEKVVFQAVERVGDEEQEDPFYAMFVADLAEVDGVPKLENIKRVSPEGSANTCGWFDPVDPDGVQQGDVIIVTHIRPVALRRVQRVPVEWSV